eukprot:GFUD01032766.1.p1 GENE.GFUD01032766.1~~GFUD01032766.1.p1  ORF type:complete len:1185 (+),score=365.80 GFUD01032766.1:68-3622(+)
MSDSELRIKKVSLPILRSSEFLNQLKRDTSRQSDLIRKMSCDNIQPGRRGRPPKVQKLINDIRKTKSMSSPSNRDRGSDNQLTRSGSLRATQAEEREQDDIGCIEEEDVLKGSTRGSTTVDSIRKEFASEIDLIQKKVNFSLQKKELEIEKLRNSNTSLQNNNNLLSQKNKDLQLTVEELKKSNALEKISSEKLEEEKSVAISDNKTLVKRIQAMQEEESECVNKLEKERNMLNAKLADREGKLSKLTELLVPLRGKVKEQEKLRTLLNQATGENKSLHVVNEEIRKELTSLNQKHQDSLAAKEKVLDSSRKLLEENKCKIDRARKEVEGKQKIIEEEKVRFQDAKLNFSLESKAIEVLKQELDEAKKLIESEKSFLVEEQKAIQEDKIVLDMEWGDIMQKKNEYEQLANMSDENGVVKEKQKEVEKIEVENKSLKKIIDDNEARLQELLVKHEHVKLEIDVMKDGFKTTIKGLEATNAEVNLSKHALAKDLEGKDVTIAGLKEHVATSMRNLKDANINLAIKIKKIENLRKRVDELSVKIKIKEQEFAIEIKDLENKSYVYKSNDKKISTTIIKQKEEEIEKLKETVSKLTNRAKRKLSEYEQELPKKFKKSITEKFADVSELADILEEPQLELYEANHADTSSRSLENNIDPADNEYNDEPIDSVIGVSEEIAGKDENVVNPMAVVTDQEPSDVSSGLLKNNIVPAENEYNVEPTDAEIGVFEELTGKDESFSNPMAVITDHVTNSSALKLIAEYEDEPIDSEIEMPDEKTSKDTKALNPMANSGPVIDQVTNSSALKLIAEMDVFESFIKNSRNKTQLKVKELTKTAAQDTTMEPINSSGTQNPCNFVDETDQSTINTELTVNAENVLMQTNLNGSQENNKSKSIRDIFDDSDESVEESDLSQPTTSKEGNKFTELESNQSKVQPNLVTISNVSPPPPPITPQPTNPPLPIISNSPAQTSSRTRPEKPMITLRDINTLSSFLDQPRDLGMPLLGDVIIPTLSNTENVPTDISDDDAKEREREAEKIRDDTVKLKFHVADVVKKCLDKYYKSRDSTHGIHSRKDFEFLAGSFSKEFREDIMAAYLCSRSSLAGICMTLEDKRSIVDQILFYFEIKEAVNKFLSKYFPTNSTQFITYSSQFSNQFSREIKESHKMRHTTLVGIVLTPDSQQWIGNQIEFFFNT